jgi:ABC-type phosphate/phosphonate transport system substrate-binding protein
MKTRHWLPVAFVVLVSGVVVHWLAYAQDVASQSQSVNPVVQRIRIGVDIRMGFQSCIDTWTPITEYLSKTIPECRFVVIPLASQQDLVRMLESHGLDFLAVDPAMELLAEDRFGAVPLATMIEYGRDDKKTMSTNESCSGAIIRRADRSDIHTLRDLRGKQVAAVKPWSLTGWIAQWALLKRKQIDPESSLKRVVFEGTHGQVVKSVLNGSADAGALDTELLFDLLRNGKIPEDSLYIMNQQGDAVPLALDRAVTTTALYPGRILAKTAITTDALAQRVAEVLMRETLATNRDGMPYYMSWTIPANYSNVRQTLQFLMGPNFAESPGYPLPKRYPAWMFQMMVFAGILLVFGVLLMIIRSRYRRHVGFVAEQLEITRKEIVEVRADKQRMDMILSLAGCGIDIVDDNDQMIYADSGIERQYGDWKGKKCHEYFCGTSMPCSCCNRPGPLDEEKLHIQNFDCSEWSTLVNIASQGPPDGKPTMQMIGVPFHDENGQWLFARIHVPLVAPAPKEITDIDRIVGVR